MLLNFIPLEINNMYNEFKLKYLHLKSEPLTYGTRFKRKKIKFVFSYYNKKNKSSWNFQKFKDRYVTFFLAVLLYADESKVLIYVKLMGYVNFHLFQHYYVIMML